MKSIVVIIIAFVSSGFWDPGVSPSTPATCFDNIPAGSDTIALPPRKVECLRNIFNDAILKTPRQFDRTYRRGQTEDKTISLTFADISKKAPLSKTYVVKQLKIPTSKTYKAFVIQQVVGADEEDIFFVLFTIDQSGKLIDNIIVGAYVNDYTRDWAFTDVDQFTIRERTANEDPDFGPGYVGKFKIRDDGTIGLSK